MPKSCYIGLIAILLISMVTAGNAQVSAWHQAVNQADLPDYQQGVILLKVKVGIRPHDNQTDQVSFGQPSLDLLLEQYEVTSLKKRFKHKPIPRGSGLPDISRIYQVEFPEDINVWEVSSAFGDNPNIEYAEPVPIYRAAEIPDDPMYISQQHLPQIMAAEAWDIHKGENGEEVVVAIIDTGVDWLHPDLTENAWQNLGEDADGDGVTLVYNGTAWERDPDDLNGVDDDGNGFVDDVIGWDFMEEAQLGDGSNPDPLWNQGPFEHGTHCAGLAAGRTNNGVGISSVSWNVKYMATQVDNGNDNFTYAWDAIIYAADNGADIISNSWGGPGYSLAGEETVAYAVGMGSIVVVAAHNYNTSTLYYPAAYPGAISIAALNANDTRANFTNYGLWIDISAPGVGILSTVTNSSYASWNGTSMATPIVAGLMALVKSYNPGWSNDEILTQVIGTADDISALNPGYENFLGSGRINAFHALDDIGVTVPEILKLDILNYNLEDGNGNGMLEPGDEVTISAKFRNFSQLYGNDEVVFTLVSDDPQVAITNSSFTMEVPPDAEFEIEEAFTFEVNEGAETHVATFFIEVTADAQVIMGKDFRMDLVIAPTGFCVWDGEQGSDGYSGTFIQQYLLDQGHEVIFLELYPHSFNGFDGVFLSFGNAGENTDQAVLYEYEHSEPIQEYLINGGSLYIEGMAIMSLPDYFSFPNAAVLKNLFGVASSVVGFLSNPISSLEGQEGTLTEGMTFTASNQVNNWYIDQIIPASSANIPFVEDGYGNVSVANAGNLGQKTFYLGYAMADLVDVDPVSSRYNMLVRTMDFFGYSQPADFVVANFEVNETEVLPGDEIQFSDWSISANGYTIDSWAWDFDEDGEIDSYDQNPSWIYNQGGNYDITLIASNGQATDTLTRKDQVLVKAGIFVYEGMENGVDQSGSFIRDYLQDNGYDVVYANHMPQSLDGFEAVFASFGSAYYASPELDNTISNILKNYLLNGGRMYLEGAEALGNDQAGNNLLWYSFGLENVVNGLENELSMLAGQSGSIMEGMEFNASSQLDVSSIDIFEPYVTDAAVPAFEESDYGVVAVQFDGTEFYGQKTFCMSYSLAKLEDGNFPNTTAELLQRVLNFFDVATGLDEGADMPAHEVKVYPNPANDHLMLEIHRYQNADCIVEVFDVWGQKVIHNHSETQAIVKLNVRNLSPGTYFYKISAGQILQTGKLMIVR